MFRIFRKACTNTDTVDLQGYKIGHTRVKCPVETCLSWRNGYCTDKEVDLCMQMKNNYDQYGMYCKKYVYGSVVDARL